MIMFDLRFPEIVEKKLIQTERFLDSIGIAPSTYVIAPQGSAPTPLSGFVTIGYEEARFDDNDFLANVQISLNDHTAHAVMGFRDSLLFLSFLCENPEVLTPFSKGNSGASQEECLNIFGLDAALFKDSVARWAQGTFLARDNDRMCVFSVDTHGEISRLAETKDALLGALILRVILDIPASGISSRRARFMPT